MNGMRLHKDIATTIASSLAEEHGEEAISDVLMGVALFLVSLAQTTHPSAIRSIAEASQAIFDAQAGPVIQ